MRTTLYGYVIKNGKAFIDKEKADQIRKLYTGYLGGLALRSAALEAGMNTYHGSAGRLLQNKKYIGTDFYPAIIDEEIFLNVQLERENRATRLGRVYEVSEDVKILSPTKFRFKSKDIMFNDPFQQAEYAYSMIESEWF